MLTGAGRFHRGVERKDGGLEGNAIDQADDLCNARCACVDLTRALYHLLPGLRTKAGHGAGSGHNIGHNLARLLRTLSVAVRSGGELLYRAAGLPQRAGLGLGVRGQVGLAVGNLS